MYALFTESKGQEGEGAMDIKACPGRRAACDIRFCKCSKSPERPAAFLSASETHGESTGRGQESPPCETVKKLCFFVDYRAAGEREGVKTHLALQ